MRYNNYLIAFILLISTLHQVYADTIPDNSIIYGIWEKEHSPYLIMGEVSVPSDSTLVIEPGVTILLKSSTIDSSFIYSSLGVGLIKVYGRIVANGTENDSIWITGDGPGNWGSISLMDTTGETNYFKYCNISYGRDINTAPSGSGFIGGIVFHGTNGIVENCISENNPYGIYALYSNMVIKNCILRWNKDGITFNRSVALIENNHVYENGENGIESHTSTSLIINNLSENNRRGISCYESFDTISNNTLVNNLYAGVELIRSNSIVCKNLIYGSNSGIRCSGTPRIINNTVINNNFVGIYCDYEAKPIIVNSIIYGNKKLFFSHSNDTIVIVNSLVEADSMPDEVIYSNENIFNQYPNFADTLNGNFELQWNSPCIDRGTHLFIWNNDTILNLSPNQYFGLAPDIGTYESPYVVGKSENPVLESKILSQNYPNPFVQLTKINIQPRSNEKSNLSIYNLNGKLVKSFIINGQGNHTITWNGVDNAGNRVKPGVYYYQLKCNDGTFTKKMILNK